MGKTHRLSDEEPDIMEAQDEELPDFDPLDSADEDAYDEIM